LTDRLHDSVEVPDSSLKREIGGVPLRHSASATVKHDQLVVVSKPPQ
jgi:hypothetical protein